MILKKFKSNKLSLFAFLAIFITTGFFILNSRSFVLASQNCGFNFYKTGAWTTSDVCNIYSGYEGLALGNLTISPGGQVTIAADATLVLSPGYTINFTAGNTTGKVNVTQPRAGTPPGRPAVVHGNLCAADADGDGYADKTTLYSGQYEPTWPTYAANNDACPGGYTKRQNLADLPGGAWQLDCVPNNASVQKLNCVASEAVGGWGQVSGFSCGTSYCGSGQLLERHTITRTVTTAADCGGSACAATGTEDRCTVCGSCSPGATRINYCGIGECYAGTQVTCTSAGEWPATCTPGTPTTETCNGKDDNCDVPADNGLTQPSQACTVGVGTCQRTGTQYKTCQGVSGWSGWGACSVTPPPPPTCGTLGYNCGSPSDTCGGTLSCGSCTYCNSYVCGNCTNGTNTSCDGNADGYSCGTKTCSGGNWGSCTGDPGVAWYYRDVDGDGYGDPNVATLSCAGQGSISYGGYTYRNNSYDCNDSTSGVTTSSSTAHAGSCGSGACIASYTNNTCSYGTWTTGTCTPGTAETNAAFCARYGAACGSLTGTDNCNAGRTVASCGTCTSPQTCSGNSCITGCSPESDSTFCGRYGYSCGSLSGTDNCGNSRYVASCGGCTTGYTCNGSSCVPSGGGGTCTPYSCCCDLTGSYGTMSCSLPPAARNKPVPLAYDYVKIASVSNDGVHFAARNSCSGLCGNCGQACTWCPVINATCRSIDVPGLGWVGGECVGDV